MEDSVGVGTCAAPTDTCAGSRLRPIVAVKLFPTAVPGAALPLSVPVQPLNPLPDPLRAEELLYGPAWQASTPHLPSCPWGVATAGPGLRANASAHPVLAAHPAHVPHGSVELGGVRSGPSVSGRMAAGFLPPHPTLSPQATLRCPSTHLRAPSYPLLSSDGPSAARPALRSSPLHFFPVLCGTDRRDIPVLPDVWRPFLRTLNVSRVRAGLFPGGDHHTSLLESGGGEGAGFTTKFPERLLSPKTQSPCPWRPRS